MANYVKSTNFAIKDSLTTGDAAKKVKGTEIDVEFNNIASAISSKLDQSADISITGRFSTSQAGTVSAPSYSLSTDTNTGIYFPAADKMAITTGGVEMMLFDSTKTVSPTTEYVAFKRSVWAPAPDCGVLDIGRESSVYGGSAISTIGGSTFLAFQIEDFEKVRITDTGNVGIGSSSPIDRLVVIGSSSGTGSSTVNFRNSSSTELLRIRDDGVFYTGGATFSPYNNTTGSAANVFIGPSGDLYRSTSSIKYKTDVTDYDKGLNAVMAMRPVYYKDNRTDENRLIGDQRFAGFIAEEIHNAGLEEFVQYNTKNEPDALSYGNITALLTKAIQELKVELDAVKAELATLKGN